MAWSGSFASGYGVPGNSYSPWLQIDWKVSSQNVDTNKSYVDIDLWMKIEGYIRYTSTMYGNLQGTSFTNNQNTGSYRWVKLSSKSITVDHNRDGTGSVNLYASYDLKINFSGTNMKPMSLSRTVSLPTIPRASTVPHFSFHSPFEEGKANWVDLGTSGIQVESSRFTHQLWIMDGNATILNLGTVRGGVRWVDITPAQSNTMLRNMSTTYNKNFTLWVNTVNSSGDKVGSEVLKTARAYVHSDIGPSITKNLTIKIDGNGKDVSFNEFLKGVSKVHGSFDGVAGAGATVDRYELVVRRVSGGADRTETRGKNVARREDFKYSGLYEAWGDVYDTRGKRVWTQTETFTVYDYEAPRITSFSAKRLTTDTTVQTNSRGSFSTVNGKNVLRFSIRRRESGGGSWESVNTRNITTANFSQQITSYRNTASSSYDFELTISDTYGNSASSSIKVSTAKVLMDLNKDEGVGIGKVHERGSLDVAGAIYTNNMRLDMAPKFKEVAPNARDTSTFWTNLPQGSYKVGVGDFPGQPANYGLIHVINDEDKIDWSVVFYGQGPGAQPIWRKHGNHVRNNPWEPITAERGSNRYGDWVKFPDGTMICETTVNIRSGNKVSYGALYYLYTTPGDWTFPQTFIDTPTISYASANTNSFFTDSGVNRSRIRTIIAYYLTSGISSGTIPLKLTATGRWK